MTYAEELFADIRKVVVSDAPMPQRYRLMGRILDRMLKERTQQDEVEYCGLVPRIYALCQRYGVSHQPLSILYSNIIRTRKAAYRPEEQDLLFDAKALCQAVAAFYDVQVPTDIAQRLPEQWRAWQTDMPVEDARIRLLVESWDEQFIYGYAQDDSGQNLLRVANAPEWHLADVLYPLATLGLLNVSTDADGVLHPRLYVLEPDYLVDITSICQCIKESGPTPMFYLMEKFMPREETLAIQLGNAANQFLDDAVHGEADFLRSMQRNFKDYPLRYCTLDGVDEEYFRQCRQQYANIHKAVDKLFREAGIDCATDNVMLEPSFICDALGLQGRLDLLTGDLHKIVELKSGKQDEFHGTFRMEHALQMALYKEILHYSLGLPRQDVKTLLLYSRYPNLFDIRLGSSYIQQAMALRNGIVGIDRRLRTDCHAWLRTIQESDFNPLGSRSKLYTDYIKPRVEAFLKVLHDASPLEYDYFCTMTSFVQREQLLAKTGDDRPDSDRGFAQAWLQDADTKRLHGNIITDLRLTPVTNDEGALTHAWADLEGDDTAQPNFREGDSVVLYERNGDADLMTNRQSLRCYIEELHPDRLLLRLAHPQRSAACLKADSRYAIESGHSDALFAAMYRGLFALLTAPEQRRDLVLGLRKPETDDSVELMQTYGSEELSDILLHTLRARDYHLLVGPPGSGKTSIALANMVKELLLHEPDGNILLLAYTNRAVDEICQMLGAEPYLRIGQELACAPQFRPRLVRNQIAHCRNRNEILAHIAPVRVFCGTVASLCAMPELFLLKHFHTALLDEASQVLEPQLLPLLTCRGRNGEMGIDRFVFIGDHRQLPAVVVQHASQSAVQSPTLRDIGLLDCRQSLFERLHRLAPEQCDMLTYQGRMHEAISEFVCQSYYDGRLRPVPLPHQTEPLGWTNYAPQDERQGLIATRRMGLRHVEPDTGEANNKVNEHEAEEVARMVGELYHLALLNHKPWEPARGVGIIVPFRGQIAMVRQWLQRLDIPDWQRITIDTVERYQGSQRDVILFSTVVRQRYQMDILSTPSESDGVPVDRRLNVAVTRARHQFFLIGNLPLLRLAPDYRNLINYIENLNVPYASSAPTMS